MGWPAKTLTHQAQLSLRNADRLFMRKFSFAALLVGITVFSAPGAAMAACEAVGSMDDGLRGAQVVFVGTVTHVENGDRTATFDVQWVWKGKNVVEQVIVHGGGTDPTIISAEDRQFQVGITYLVVSNSVRAPYDADRCTVTRPWQGIGAAIPPNFQDAVGVAAGWSPDPIVVVEESGPSLFSGPIVPITIGAIVLIGLFVALGRITRGPEHAPKGRPGQSATKPGRSRSRLPSLGRKGDGLSGRLRRSGVAQAKQLRGIRNGKQGRKAARLAKSAQAKGRKGGLRTDRLASAEGDNSSKTKARI